MPWGRALAGDLEGVHTQEQTTEEFRFGEFAGPEPLRDARTQVTSLRLSEYPTARAELRLRLPSDRYFADGEPVELSPRNYGILLHRVFEQATTTAEIEEAIRAMTLEGSLDEQEAGRLRRMVAQALGDPLARSWFDGSWDCVRNEQTIVVPGETSVRRRANYRPQRYVGGNGIGARRKLAAARVTVLFHLFAVKTQQIGAGTG